MSAFVPLNPRPMLQSLVNEDVLIRLKWNKTEYKGRLQSVDSYMNVLLANTEEITDGKNMGSLGQVLIRCNNILWISAADAPSRRSDGSTEFLAVVVPKVEEQSPKIKREDAEGKN
ncbi:LSM-domain-containing protein [Saccharata proteae CBS 121410]|uniref:Sm protein F n=1 Tax=Saccharata proteae CBS 121410 TaxID=1314787 RepID=A0A9P4LVB0_9PEZI|nr:LSM-domain-containing protein [Saccharata proteae CBS 121410]